MNKTQKGFALVEGLLITLILVIIGFGGYYVWNTQKNTDKTNADTLKASQSTPAVSAVNKSNSEAELVAEAIGNDCAKIDPSVNKGALISKLNDTFTGSDQFFVADSGYARASGFCDVSGEGGGGAYFLKKTSGAWKIMFKTQQALTCSQVDGQGWPSSVVAQCYDSNTDTSRAPK